MKAQQIRELFLDYFEQKGHKIVKSSSLLPKDDPTLLFTNAGMNQFKNVFLGLEKRSYIRAASVQKCMRVSGKHNDLEQVGQTNRHHTFFEMLGNFSFGDYFKEEAIAFGWEFVTETLGLDKNRLYITVYKEDDDAYTLWNKGIGIPVNRLFRFGKKDNFWTMGETGPCGPCSEIHYDLDPGARSEGDPRELIQNGSARFLELWNLVFMQFHLDEKGNRSPLPSPSIDTGMGLERLAAVLQQKKSNFDTDLFVPLIEAACEIVQKEYGEDKDADVSLRVIADHVRAVTFLAGDGIMPANEGRGYVLRRLIRRAYRRGNALGLDGPFLYRLVGGVADIMKGAYPELLSSAEYISRICLSEERRFASTLSSGLKTFRQFIAAAKKDKKTVLSGAGVFKLYDTYGFPLELSRELAAESRMDVDEKGFQKEMELQREKARKAWKNDSDLRPKKVYESLRALPQQFVGYETGSVAESRVTALLSGGKKVAELKEGESGEIFLEQTPFYAEAGGQVGDSGILKNSRFSSVVETAFYPIPDVIAHKVRILSGKIMVDDRVEASIDIPRRKAASRNHTATHLLHAALRRILGEHVKQAGSLVAPDRMRFDFTHFSPLTKAEIDRIESIINEKIQENLPVETAVLSLEEGLRLGAMAIFEEKYGENVRMVSVPGFSRELCGGIHVHATGDIGVFKIISESSIAAGMRRIEALTGKAVLQHVKEEEEILEEMQKQLHSPKKELAAQIEKLKESLKTLERKNKSLRQKMAREQLSDQAAEIQNILGIDVLIKRVDGLSNDEIRNLSDSLRQKIKKGIVILGTAREGKVFLTAAVSKDLLKRIHADALIKKIAPLVKGGGGGRPDFAQAGGAEPEHLNDALKKSAAIIKDLLG